MKWKRVKIRIEGQTPLLMHSAQNMEEQSIKSNPTKTYDHKEYAESVAYRTKKGELMIPARCLKRAIINASSWFKIGKRSAKPIIAGLTRIEPLEIPIKNSKGKVLYKYDIDLRPVVVNRARIIRARPRLDEWVCDFEIVYPEGQINPKEHLQDVLEQTGMRVGLLDNRPDQSYGENGTFKVTKFKVGK